MSSIKENNLIINPRGMRLSVIIDNSSQESIFGSLNINLKDYLGTHLNLRYKCFMNYFLNDKNQIVMCETYMLYRLLHRYLTLFCGDGIEFNLDPIRKFL